MNKALFHIVLAVFPLFLAAQQKPSVKVEKTWHDIRETHGFRRSKDYEGPEGKGYIYPSTIKESQHITQQQGSSTTQPYKGTPYSNHQIQQGRQIPKSAHGGGGTLKRDPRIAKPDPITIPDIDAPDIDIDAPDIDVPSVSGEFWKYFLIILLLILIAIIIFYAIRNRAPKNSTIPLEALEDNLNPAEIPKTELELRLEEALSRDDFRECVRIYFLIAMKELIDKRWIYWKKEKTNIHYIIEMQGKPTAHDFEKVVSIYELVWYGDYHIDAKAYASVEPKLSSYYKHLESLK